MNPPISVALADDHTLFREGIRQMVTSADIEVVGQASTGQGALALVLAERPDALLLDVEMPGPGAETVIRTVRSCAPDTHVIVLTMHNEPEVARELLDCGAAAFLVKTVLCDELIAALRSVCHSQDTVLPAAVEQTSDPFGVVPVPAQPGDRPLTDREREVLRLTAQALTNTQIGTRLHITAATVKRHLTNIYAKLNAVSRVDAIRRATANGLL